MGKYVKAHDFAPISVLSTFPAAEKASELCMMSLEGVTMLPEGLCFCMKIISRDLIIEHIALSTARPFVEKK